MSSNENAIDDNLTPIWPAEVANILGEVPDRLHLNAGQRVLLGQGPAIHPSSGTGYWSPFNFPFVDYVGTGGAHVWMAASRLAAAHPSADTASCVLGGPSWSAKGEQTTGNLIDCINIWLTYTMLPSAHATFRQQPFYGQGGSLESASVAQAINDALLTSTGHGIRLFPIWAVPLCPPCCD
jgi:hypothetical protein